MRYSQSHPASSLAQPVFTTIQHGKPVFAPDTSIRADHGPLMLGAPVVRTPSSTTNTLMVLLEQCSSLLRTQWVTLVLLDLEQGETIVNLAQGMRSGMEPLMRGQCSVPMFIHDHIVGTLHVWRAQPLIATEQRLLEGLATIAASVIDEWYRARQAQQELQDGPLTEWMHALDKHDSETRAHSVRVMEMTVELMRALGTADDDLLEVRRGALLHDIGKLAIPDAILRKPGPLTADERHLMEQHPRYAAALMVALPTIGPALDIPRFHHERWDGSGYPYGLHGEQIPLAARAFAVVDVWDALNSHRPYRAAWDETRVIAYLQEEAGTLFDPAIVPVFLRLLDEQPHLFRLQDRRIVE